MMKNLFILVFGIWLVYTGLSALITGETVTFFGPGAISSRRIVTYQDSQYMFIFDVIVRFSLGAAAIVAAFNLIRK